MDLMLLKNSIFIWKHSFLIRKCSSSQNVDVSGSVHYSFYRNQKPDAFPGETFPEHLLQRMFDLLVDVRS